VRFHWFAQQYYTQLAADYGDTVRSSWVTAPVSAADPAQIGRDYGMYLRLMQGADRLGWDSLLLNEHHQSSLAMTPSPNLIAAILAHTTESAAIALCGNSLALYNPPLRVAEELAMLDCLSGGRLIAGMVFGTPMDSAFSYGVPPVELRERFYEARELITRSWKATEPFAFNGKYTKLRYVNPWPRPVQADVPIWIPGSGSLETWELVNTFDYCYGYLSFAGKKAAEPIVNGFWDFTEQHGGNLNPNRMAFTQIICCADTDKEAEAQYADAVRYFHRQNPVPLEFATPPGYLTQASLRGSLTRASALSMEERRKAMRARVHHRRFAGPGGAATPRVDHRVAAGSAHHLHAHRQPAGGGRRPEQRAGRHEGHPAAPRHLERIRGPLDPEGQPGARRRPLRGDTDRLTAGRRETGTSPCQPSPARRSARSP
jgi:alkanesulfonate monooxygenase SsuD/methylene tetrahydromethanopterin reductase-like flavin-dependent oxidoreductase (luciferase family)